VLEEAFRAAEKQARSELGDWDWDPFRDDDFGTIGRLMKDLEVMERLARIIHDSTPFSSPRGARAPSTSPDLIRIGV